MAASDYFPDLPDIGDVLESEFRQRGWNYNKIEKEGITKVRNVNFGKDDEPGSPNYGKDVIFTEKEFIPLQHSTDYRGKYNKKTNMSKKEERTDYGKVLVIAPSGYGKTFIAKTANPETIGFVNAENKPLSFKANFKFHGKPKNWAGFLKNIEDYGNNPEITQLFIDSQSMAFDTLQAEMKNNFKGYDIYSNYNTQLKRYFDLIKSIQKDIIVLSHDETVTVEGFKQRRAKVHGKEYEGRVEAQFTIVLFAGKKLEDNKPKYFLRTFEEDTSTKVPEGLFDNKLEIPNDADYIFKALENYYK